MDPNKARAFWQSVMNSKATLCGLLDALPNEHGFQERIQRIGQVVQMLRDAAAEIDPLLTIEVEQVPAADSAVLRIAVGCNHDSDGIDAVQALVAAAPTMPPSIQVCAFTPPMPREMARELTSLENLGKEVPV